MFGGPETAIGPRWSPRCPQGLAFRRLPESPGEDLAPARQPEPIAAIDVSLHQRAAAEERLSGAWFGVGKSYMQHKFFFKNLY